MNLFIYLIHFRELGQKYNIIIVYFLKKMLLRLLSGFLLLRTSWAELTYLFLFGSNENFKICFRDLLTFRSFDEKKIKIQILTIHWTVIRPWISHSKSDQLFEERSKKGLGCSLGTLLKSEGFSLKFNKQKKKLKFLNLLGHNWTCCHPHFHRCTLLGIWLRTSFGPFQHWFPINKIHTKSPNSTY